MFQNYVWEEQFPSLKPKRDRAGDRKYTSADIDHVKLLVNLIDTQGYTIEGAKRAIRTKEYKKPQNAEVIKTLEDLKDFLVFLRKGLDNENESDSEESNPDNFLPEEE
ncbi:MerR family transcriptional regulator [Pseudarcicella hirudinis]|uniref:MerR family transcriptional regulator n=1 Tax=Pseudarcicella hirudinis TaxID=1079859 RepID=UPI0035EECDCC